MSCILTGTSNSRKPTLPGSKSYKLSKKMDVTRLPCESNTQRCGTCPGCMTMQWEKACQCHSCKNQKGCVEYHHLCAQWDKTTINYYAASSIAGSSIHFDLSLGDLSNYRHVVQRVRTLAIELDFALDDFPRGAPQRSNPRYGKALPDQDIEHKDLQLSNVETVLLYFQMQRDRLDELRDDNDTDENIDHEPPDPHSVDLGMYQTAPKSLHELLTRAASGIGMSKGDTGKTPISGQYDQVDARNMTDSQAIPEIVAVLQQQLRI